MNRLTENITFTSVEFDQKFIWLNVVQLNELEPEKAISHKSF
jgi:hypothetical protein